MMNLYVVTVNYEHLYVFKTLSNALDLFYTQANAAENDLQRYNMDHGKGFIPTLNPDKIENDLEKWGQASFENLYITLKIEQAQAGESL